MSVQDDPRVRRVEGRALPLSGGDIDTDRIMPARFLKAVSFDGLEAHVFEDDRRAAASASLVHPFDDPRFAGASVLVVGRNFGCGSSREHAPQGLVRWGIRAVVGESFAEIFFSNATSLGVPCMTLAGDDAAMLRELIERDPAITVVVDVAAQMVMAAGRSWTSAIASSAREALLTGAWEATALLTADFDQVRATAARLPYLSGY